jgi:DNA-binding beta-propeller fold protein YncE
MKKLVTKSKYSVILIALIASVLSCSPKIQSNMMVQKKSVFFPKETDTARFQFLTSYSKSSDIMAKQSGFKASIVGEQEVIHIGKPFGIAISNGKIYICDSDNREIKVLDLENKDFKSYKPKVKRGFAQAMNIFIDEEGLIYLVSPLKRLISIYDDNMNHITEFGPDVNYRPIDIAVKNDKIYIVDIGNNRVNIFDKTTKELIGFFPDSVVGNDDWLYSPTSISVSDNQIYITDTGDFSLKVYSLEGEFLKKIGSVGDGLGQFTRPKGNAVDKEGNIYVLDAAFENAQIFNKEGQLLMFFGGPYNGPGDMYMPAEIIVDYKNKDYFKHLVDNKYDLLNLIIVTNQYGPEKVSVYGRVELKK